MCRGTKKYISITIFKEQKLLSINQKLGEVNQKLGEVNQKLGEDSKFYFQLPNDPGWGRAVA